VGVLFGLWPRFFVVFGALLFASLFPLAKRKSGWGICGSSCFGCFLWFLCVVLFDLPAQNGHVMSLYKRLSNSLCSCKDRAFSATSATLEGKKIELAMIASSTALMQACKRGVPSAVQSVVFGAVG